MRKNNFMNKIIKLKGSILAGIIQIFACLIVYKFNIPNPNIVLFVVLSEYSRAMKSHFRKFGNQMSGSGNHLCNYASLLA